MPVFPPVALKNNLRPPIPPSPPRWTGKKEISFDLQNLLFLPSYLLDFDDQTYFAPKLGPIFETDFSRPKTSLIDKKNNTIEIIPQVKEKQKEPDISEINLSKELSKLFPDIDEKINQDKTKIPKVELSQLSEILSEINRGEIPKQLQFFTGGENQDFESRAKVIGLSTDSSEFLNFLKSSTCEYLLTNNKLKIHIETGIIYYDNTDTNESIYGFFQLQEDQTKKFIDFEFTYDETYQKYFDEFLLQINGQADNTLDLLTNKNSTFLFYHFNDFLSRVNIPTKLLGIVK